MLATILATVRLLRALARAIADPATRGVVAIGVVTLASGTAFYSSVEGWGALDAFYFSVVTLTTIGYGDLAPASDAAKIFTIIYSLVGIGVIASLITAIAMSVVQQRPHLSRLRHRGRPATKEPDADDHGPAPDAS